MKFATPEDARATVAKVRRVNKPYARKMQILTVGEQRAKVIGKTEVVNIFKKAKLDLKKRRDEKNTEKSQVSDARERHRTQIQSLRQRQNRELETGKKLIKQKKKENKEKKEREKEREQRTRTEDAHGLSVHLDISLIGN